VILRAAAALPHDDRERAVEELRSQLRIMAAAAAVIPDWTTLTVTGPTEMTAVDERSWFEWAAKIAVHGASLEEVPDPDRVPGPAQVDHR
jgi:hypothetical protein